MRLVEEDGTVKGVQYKNKDGQELTSYAPLTIVCDGCSSNLRRSLCDPKVCDVLLLIHVEFLILFWVTRKIRRYNMRMCTG